MTTHSAALRVAAILALGFIASGLWSGNTGTVLSQSGTMYQVTVTNLTRGQQFTPTIAATHGEQTQLFSLGSPASTELAILAEEGDTAPLAGLLAATPGVRDIKTTGGLLNPGDSVRLMIQAGGATGRISLASMLIPTNDAFIALNGVELPRNLASVTYFSPAYDAGSERNDELCASIPGPSFIECNGPGGGGNPSGGNEGYVHIHAGIQGIGNLMRPLRDWRNPVAQIVIRRLP